MLVNRGEEVVIFDIAINRQCIEDIQGKVKLVQGDLGNFSEVLNVIKQNKITKIYHLGAMLSYVSESNPWGAFRSNIVGTYNVLEAARLFDVEKIMFSSSGAVFSLEAGTDTTIQRPSTVYGDCKLYGEGLGRFYRTKFDLDFRSIRYPMVIGPGVRTPAHWGSAMIENSVLKRAYQCPVNETSTMAVMFFKDAAKAADMVLEAPKERIKMVNYNIAGIPEAVSAKELEKAIKEHLPDTVITYSPDPTTMVVQKAVSAIRIINDKCAREEWNWKPTCTSIREMVASFIAEMKDHPGLYKWH
jgi:threonine 3-dehydrogenase